MQHKSETILFLGISPITGINVSDLYVQLAFAEISLCRARRRRLPGSGPIVIDVNSLHWDDGADVVVIGYGGAGASAALEAREHGADVLIVERFGGGGTTQDAGGTRFQKEAGYDEDSEKMYT